MNDSRGYIFVPQRGGIKNIVAYGIVLHVPLSQEPRASPPGGYV
jgi:hypothetical protein